jgi:hypothetical protein
LKRIKLEKTQFAWPYDNKTISVGKV